MKKTYCPVFPLHRFPKSGQSACSTAWTILESIVAASTDTHVRCICSPVMFTAITAMAEGIGMTANPEGSNGRIAMFSLVAAIVFIMPILRSMMETSYHG